MQCNACLALLGPVLLGPAPLREVLREILREGASAAPPLSVAAEPGSLGWAEQEPARWAPALGAPASTEGQGVRSG